MDGRSAVYPGVAEDMKDPMEKLDPKKFAPIGRWGHLLEEEGVNEWPDFVRDYSPEHIYDAVYPSRVSDPWIAKYYSEYVWQTMRDRAEDTDEEVTWKELLKETIEEYTYMIFPPFKDGS